MPIIETEIKIAPTPSSCGCVRTFYSRTATLPTEHGEDRTQETGDFSSVPTSDGYAEVWLRSQNYGQDLGVRITVAARSRSEMTDSDGDPIIVEEWTTTTDFSLPRKQAAALARQIRAMLGA